MSGQSWCGQNTWTVSRSRPPGPSAIVTSRYEPSAARSGSPTTVPSVWMSSRLLLFVSCWSWRCSSVRWRGLSWLSSGGGTYDGATGVRAVASLFLTEASADELPTRATLTIGSGPLYPDGTPNVAVITFVSPAPTVPIWHGKDVVQAPPFETNVSPVGVGSWTDTLLAGWPPLLVTAIV